MPGEHRSPDGGHQLRQPRPRPEETAPNLVGPTPYQRGGPEKREWQSRHLAAPAGSAAKRSRFPVFPSRPGRVPTNDRAMTSAIAHPEPPPEVRVPESSWDPEDPWDRVSRLLPVALSADVSRERRLQAITALSELDESALHRLALDSEWRGVLGLLADAADVDSDDDSSSSPPPSPRTAARGPSGPRYSRELRRLVDDDFARGRAIIAAVPTGAPTVEERLRAAAAASPLDPRTVAPVDYARRLAWSTTAMASGFVVIGEMWPGMEEAEQAFLEEVLRAAGRLAIPPRLASFVSVVLGRFPSHQVWILELLSDLEDVAAGAAVGPDCVDALVARHLDARLDIARAVRDREVLHPEVLAVLEMWATVALTRAAGARDVARAFGACSVRDGVSEFRRAVRRDDLLWERALQAVMRTTDTAWQQRLGPRDMDALAFAAAVRRRPAGPERDILLLDTWTPADQAL